MGDKVNLNIRNKATTLLACCIIAATLGGFARGDDASAVDAEAELATAIRAAATEVAPAVLRIETFGGLEKVDGTLVSSGPATAPWWRATVT